MEIGTTVGVSLADFDDRQIVIDDQPYFQISRGRLDVGDLVDDSVHNDALAWSFE